MKLLIDSALASMVAVWLREAGHDAVHVRDTTPEKTASLLVQVLPTIESDLDSGSVVVITDNRMRIRHLPVKTDEP